MMLVLVGVLIALVEVDVSLASALHSPSACILNFYFSLGFGGRGLEGTYADMIISIQTLPNRAVGNHDVVVHDAWRRGADVR